MPKRVQQISSLLGPLLASAILTLGCLAQAPNPMATPVQDFVDRTHAGDHPAAFNAVLKLAEEVGTAPLPEVEEVLPSIVQAVDDKDPYVRALALTSLVAVESRSNPDHTVRGDALPAL
ncbi:MAG TPA: hypothetical protein VK627_06510, partial [Edaphobacter sp.]|nr:hypothetical protein [Edaphobacter sp.]